MDVKINAFCTSYLCSNFPLYFKLASFMVIFLYVSGLSFMFEKDTHVIEEV